MKRGRWHIVWLIFGFLVAVLIGILLARYNYKVSLGLWASGFVALPLVVKRRLLAIVPFVILGLSLGLWRGSQIQNKLQVYDSLHGQDVTIIAKVSDDAVYGFRGQLEFHVDAALLNSEVELPGRLRIAGRHTDIQRGDLVDISGKLKPGFGNRQGSMSFAEINVLGRNTSSIESFRKNFIASIYSNISEPQASLGLGFLVGIRSLLPETLTEQLSATGLTHIVAVSGYNLTILINFSRRFFSRISKFASLALSSGLLLGFLTITGTSPSIVRASVVSGLSLCAWYYGRAFNPIVLLVLAGAITAFMNPLYLWLDLGWHLSFLAFFGVLVLAPLVSKRIFKDRKPKILTQTLLETSMAQLMTMPLIMFIFGEFSAVALLSNLVVLPLIPFIMLLTFIAGIGGLIFPWVAGWLAWPAELLLEYTTSAISLLSQLPWSLQELAISKEQFMVIFLLISVFWWALAKSTRIKVENA